MSRLFNILKTIAQKIASLNSKLDWLKGGEWVTTTDYLSVTGAISTEVGFRAKCNNNTGDVALQVGSGGLNHGVYSKTLDKWIIYSDGTDIYINDTNLTVTYISLPWNSGTGGTTLSVARWGKIATLSIWNPNKLAVGNNVVATLPVGYRPKIDAILPLIFPTASGTPTNALSLRATIRTNGNIEIYNYRSSAISGDTNASGTITFVVGG